uniref:Uncharacterized protein n=1 Tax=Brassica campestris TaxID=3711 RepID=M4DEG2_BRACM
MMFLGSRRTLSILELVLLSSIDIINSTIRESRSSDPFAQTLSLFPSQSKKIKLSQLPWLASPRFSCFFFIASHRTPCLSSGLEPSSNGGSSLGGQTRLRGGSWREKIGLHVQVVIPGDGGYHRFVNAGFSPGGGGSLSFAAAGSSFRRRRGFLCSVFAGFGSGGMIVRVRMDEISVEDEALHRQRRRQEKKSRDMRVVNPSLCIDGAQPLVYLPPPRSSHFPANGKFHGRCYYPTSVSMQSQSQSVASKGGAKRFGFNSNSKRSVFACNAALNAKCSQGQTQTVTRESPTITQAPTHGKEKSPKLDDGGSGFPPRDDGGGGGGGGGGESFSGGFFLFGFLMFMGYLKDLEGEHETSH